MNDKPIDPQSALRELWKMAPKYAQARAEAAYLDRYSKVLKATLMRASGEQAIGTQEREAYAAPEYLTHIEGLREAERQAEEYRWKLTAAQEAIGIWRSMEASNRGMDRAAA
jgi:hypothetical protein